MESSHSRSWFGDHSATYYGEFAPPPPGRSFNVEWGFVPGFGGDPNPGWRIYTRDEIRKHVFEGIGEDIFHATNKLAQDISGQFTILRDQTLDVLELSKSVEPKAVGRYAVSVEKLTFYDVSTFVNDALKSVPRMTRDSQEIAKGQNVPAHVQYSAPLQVVEVNRRRLRELASVIRNVIQLFELHEPEANKVPQKNLVFIGHGRSEHWRILKDFVRDRIGLDFEEFNRVSPAGLSTQERLSEMLDACGFAFLVMAAEDLHGDGSAHARENVVHEVGLFQGRLGWRKAIILLEEGCSEFSNIIGLGQIRYARGNIASCFEDVRRVLEREGLV